MQTQTQSLFWSVIINPVSGKGIARDNWNVLSSLIAQHGIHFTHCFTEYKGHIKNIIATESEKGNTHFLILGGDGSLSEAANAVMNLNLALREKIVLGLIPIGSGNDWCRTHSISRNYKLAIQQFASGQIIKHDVGYVLLDNQSNKHYFINIAGSGYNAHVVKKVNEQYPIKKPGKIIYLLSLLKYLAAYKCRNACIKTENTVINEKIFSVCFAVCKYNGGGMMQAPQAIFNDGLLTVNIIKSKPKWEIIRNLPRLKDGSFIKNKYVVTDNAIHIRIDGPSQFIEADGENIGFAPAHISIIKEAIQVVLPKNQE